MPFRVGPSSGVSWQISTLRLTVGPIQRNSPTTPLLVSFFVPSLYVPKQGRQDCGRVGATLSAVCDREVCPIQSAAQSWRGYTWGVNRIDPRCVPTTEDSTALDEWPSFKQAMALLIH